MVTAMFLKFVASNYANWCIDYSPLKVGYSPHDGIDSLRNRPASRAASQIAGRISFFGHTNEGESLLNMAQLCNVLIFNNARIPELRKYMPWTCGISITDELELAFAFTTCTQVDLWNFEAVENVEVETSFRSRLASSALARFWAI